MKFMEMKTSKSKCFFIIINIFRIACFMKKSIDFYDVHNCISTQQGIEVFFCLCFSFRDANYIQIKRIFPFNIIIIIIIKMVHAFSASSVWCCHFSVATCDTPTRVHKALQFSYMSHEMAYQYIKL